MKFKLLNDKNFSLLMFGKITSLIGSSMQGFALSLYILSTTGSASKFASILAISIIPQLILGPFAGVIVDWFYRKNILIVLDLISGVLVSIFAVIYVVTGEMTLVNIYIMIIILSVISTIDSPALQTIIPTITKKEELVDANALNSLIMSIGSVVSPAIAALVYGSLGLMGVFIINSISFFLSAISELFLVIPRSAKNKEKISMKAFLGEFKEGLNFVKKRKDIINIISLAIILNFAFGSLNVGITFISKITLRISDFQYGLLQSVTVIGTIVSTFFIKWFSKKNSIGKNIYVCFMMASFIILGYAIVTFDYFVAMENSTIYLFLLLISVNFILFIFISLGNMFAEINFQSIVPLDFMGRVGTVMTTGCMIAIPLSNMMYGYLFDKISVSIIFIFSSVIMIVAMLLYKRPLLLIGANNNEIPVEAPIEVE
ncbi:MAG: MFS transporter [Clostridium sp.]|uniref:MFS transporter n=1 Tax=Clostridium sp. TaxID=1506 RepID=UPI0025C2593C|nr:MFS transporter [Clostridium sp.]MCF0147855.1 MFS transporter [Clostridium sp.]